jgi:uncharacterized protein (TIRG00374 family)
MTDQSRQPPGFAEDLGSRVDGRPSPVARRPSSLRQQVELRPRRVLVGVLLSLLFLWLAIRGTPVAEIAGALRLADYRYVVLAVGLVLLSPLVRALRWKLLYHPHHHGLSVWRLAVILLIGQMLNIVIPARTGELARIYLMGRTGDRSRAFTLGTIAIEKWLDILMMLLLLMFMPAVVAVPGWFRDSRAGLAVFAVAFFAVGLVLSYGKQQFVRVASRLSVSLPDDWQARARRGVALALGSLDVLRSPRVGLQLQLWSAAVLALSVLVNYFTFKALGLDLSLTVALFLLAVLQVGVAVPSAPGKLGVFHYLCTLALGFFGVTRGTALGYSFLLYAIVFLPPIVLGAVSLWFEVGRPATETAAWIGAGQEQWGVGEEQRV